MRKNAFEKELLPSGFLLASVPPTQRTQHRVWLAWLLSIFAVLYLAYSNVYQLRSIPSPSAGPTLPDLYEASIAELQTGLHDGAFTSVHLVQAYLKRIDEVNLKGPALRAVLETNPSALAQAQLLDEERAVFGPRGPMHGIPILIKDNIATISSEGQLSLENKSETHLSDR
jgi:amidase